MTNSAIGDLQMFPWQINTMFLIFFILLKKTFYLVGFGYFTINTFSCVIILCKFFTKFLQFFCSCLHSCILEFAVSNMVYFYIPC